MQRLEESRSTSQFIVAPTQHFLCFFFPEPHGHGSFLLFIRQLGNPLRRPAGRV